MKVLSVHSNNTMVSPTSLFKTIAKANVRLAAFEPSSSVTREFIRIAQSKPLVEACKQFTLSVDIIDPPILSGKVEDLHQSKVDIEFHSKDKYEIKTEPDSTEKLTIHKVLADLREIVTEKNIPEK
uniref:Uncharacterized protein n=1 Tax=Mucochytrium quahogii TaxID=96639 RepID=A0A7S2W270_9STRA